MMGDVYGIGIQDWTKNATNTEEAGQAAIENCVNVRPDDNLIGKEQIWNAYHNGEYNFDDEKKHITSFFLCKK